MSSPKKCNTCNIEKDIENYHKRNKNKGGYSHTCKDCYNAKQRDYRKKSSTYKDWTVKNKEHLYEQQKKYLDSEKGKKNRREYINEYKKNRKENDPGYKIWENSRKRIWKILNVRKSHNTSTLINTTPFLFKRWIEFTMTDNMNWSNYGKLWHIDHVIPISLFNLENNQELFEAFNWQNCRAEYATFNLEKGDNIINTQVVEHKRQLQFFKIKKEFNKSLEWAIRSQVSKEI
jgi:hypothetical protein